MPGFQTIIGCHFIGASNQYLWCSCYVLMLSCVLGIPNLMKECGSQSMCVCERERDIQRKRVINQRDPIFILRRPLFMEGECIRSGREAAGKR